LIPDPFLCLESDPVTNLRASGISRAQGAEFRVEWSRPDQPNGVIMHYIVEIYNIGDDCGMERGQNSSNQVPAPSNNPTMINKTVGGLGNGHYDYHAILVYILIIFHLL
jgi:hypothetical protein